MAMAVGPSNYKPKCALKVGDRTDLIVDEICRWAGGDEYVLIEVANVAAFRR